MSTVIPLNKIRSLVTNHYPGKPSGKDAKEPQFELIIDVVEGAVTEQVTAIENLGDVSKALNHMVNEIEHVRDGVLDYLNHQIALDYLLWLREDKREFVNLELFEAWCKVHPKSAVRELTPLVMRVLREWCPEIISGDGRHSRATPAIVNAGIEMISARMDVIFRNPSKTEPAQVTICEPAAELAVEPAVDAAVNGTVG